MLNIRSLKFGNNLRSIVISNRNVVTESHKYESNNSQTCTNKFVEKLKPFSELPGPTKWDLVKSFIPRGRFNGKSFVEIHTILRSMHGDIFLMPGLFGKRDIVTTYNPKDFEIIFRTEGAQPVRRGLEVLPYYRKVLRSNIFKNFGGLLAEQGDSWWHFRSTVNPVMMNPKTTVLYAPQMNKVADKFLEHIRKIRNPQTNEVPRNFIDDLNYWAFDSICLVALDKEVDIISNSAGNPLAKKVIDSLKNFFELIFLLDVLPSAYKYLPTRNMKRFIEIMDDITALTTQYIDEALERLKQNKKNGLAPTPKHEQSVLERLVCIDRSIAVVMVIDILMSSIDTTTSAMSAILISLSKNLEKQSKLRQEIMQVLPNKSSEMSSEKFKSLPYLRACIKEALRLYPTAVGLFRATGQDVVLSGYQIPKDTDVVMPTQLLMKDPKYYQRPTEYLPERWLRNAESKSPGCSLNAKEPFIFLPFGFGPRNCIGKRLVDLELEISIAKLIRNFEIRFNYSTENMFKTHAFNLPNKPLTFQFIDLKS